MDPAIIAAIIAAAGAIIAVLIKIIVDEYSKHRSSRPPLISKEAVASKSTKERNLSELDRAILDTLSALLKPFSEKYVDATDGEKIKIKEKVSSQFCYIQREWNMSDRMFELYITICLEDAKILHKIEIIEDSLEIIKRYPEFESDIHRWLKNIVAGNGKK